MSAFNDQAKEILGVSANELKNLQETDEQAFEAVFTKVRALNDFPLCQLCELKSLPDVCACCCRALFHWVLPKLSKLQALFQEHVMTVRCKADSYKDELRVRVTMQRTAPTNYLAESRNIIDALNAMA